MKSTNGVTAPQVLERLRLPYYYLVTIEHQFKRYEVEDYEIEQILDTFHVVFPDITIIQASYEFGKIYKQLHLHLIIRSEKYFQYFKLKTLNHFHIHYKPIYTRTQLHRSQVYLSKDQWPVHALLA